MISKYLETLTGLESNDICISVDIGEMVYPYSFIHDENHKYLVIDSTGEDGCERIVLIPKDKILSVNIVYQQDVDKLFKVDKRDEMFR